MDHLACYVGGMLALGTTVPEMSEEHKTKHLALARDLTHTCMVSYSVNPTGLGPDVMGLDSAGEGEPEPIGQQELPTMKLKDMYNQENKYILRPGNYIH